MDDVIVFAAFVFLVLCASLFVYLIWEDWRRNRGQ